MFSSFFLRDHSKPEMPSSTLDPHAGSDSWTERNLQLDQNCSLARVHRFANFRVQINATVLCKQHYRSNGLFQFRQTANSRHGS